MLTAVLTFVAGLAGLLLGGHLVVDGASRIGVRMGLSAGIVGLTIVAAGTSAPELAVVLQSLAADDTPLAVGSIIGSNIANVLLVLGLAATFGAIAVTNRVVRIDIPIMIGASVALLLLSLDQRLGRTDGLLLFVSLLVFVGWTLRTASDIGGDLGPPDDEGSSEGAGATGEGAPETGSGGSNGIPDEANPATSDGDHRAAGGSAFARLRRSLSFEIGSLVVGVGFLAMAARFVVSGAEEIATSLGVPELIVGLTIVALGTSAPEVVTTVLAALQGRRDLAVGNAVGSNIFNILLVLGVGGIVADGGLEIGADAVGLDLPILLAAAVACLPMMFFDNRLDRWEGAVFVGYYIAYLLFLVLDATGHQASERFGFVMITFVIPLNLLTVAVVVLHQRRSRSEMDDPRKRSLID